MEPIVTTRNGKLRGTREGDCLVFRGIPFAAPPVGANRFQAPAPVTPWDVVRDAIEQGATAPQVESNAPPIIPDPHVPGDDYLNLNVFTPEAGSASLPVLVFIHGGGYMTGSNSSPWFHGGSFARDGVVVVNVNYRLGVEGFLAIEGAPLNRAVLDWVAALEWVRDNIAAFGGDPGKVTICGQSAGGAAVTALMAVPAARGLFHRGIAMSGVANVAPALRATEVAAKFATIAGVAPSVEALANVPTDRLLEAQARLASGGIPLVFRPVPDGEFVESMTLADVRAGQGRDVPLLVGATREEVTPLLQGNTSLDEQSAVSRMARLGLPEDGVRRYRERMGDAQPWELLGQATTDRTFRVPAVRLAEARAQAGARTFSYEFGWPSAAGLGVRPYHCLDLPFVFDNLQAEGVARCFGESRPPQQLATAMHRAWVSFITSGDPGWAAFGLEQRATMVFDEQPRVVPDALAFEREVWQGVV
jgi:para-nitrobenzyl esterase